MTTLRLAAVCPPVYAVGCRVREAIARNVAAAEPLVRAAAADGAALVLLPEAWPQGYSYNAREVWRGVDRGLPTEPCPANACLVPDDAIAPAAAALCSLASSARCHIGATVL